MLNTEELSPKQKRVMLAPYDEERLILAPGPVRCGKTASLVPAFLNWSTRFVGKDFLVAGRTMAQVNEMLYPIMEKWAIWAGVNSRRKINQKFVKMGHNRFFLYEAATEACRQKIQGFTFQGAYLDEIAIMPRGFFDEAFMRCSEPGAKILASCNPEGPYHWVKTEIIDQAKTHNHKIIPFEMADNPSLTKEYLASLHATMEGAMLRRRVYGEWAATSGLIYPNYTTEEPPRSEDPFAYDMAFDYASSTHSHALLFADYGGETIYVVDEWRTPNPQERPLSDRQQVDLLLDWLGARELRYTIVDPSAASFKAEMRTRWKTPVHDANNDVLEGIQATNTFLSKGMVKISPALFHLLSELEGYQWDEKATRRGEDKPLKVRDHAVDALRYYAMAWAKRADTDDFPTN